MDETPDAWETLLKQIKEKTAPFENDPSTWAYVLKQHWNFFTDACWKGFNKYCEEMREEVMNPLNWREYVLWDMVRRHEEEVREWAAKQEGGTQEENGET